MSNLFEQISRKIRLSVFRAERCSEQVLLNNWLYFIPGCIRHLRQVQKISLKGLRVKAFAELCHANSFVRGIFERKQKQLQWNSSGVLRLLWKLNIIWLNLSPVGTVGVTRPFRIIHTFYSLVHFWSLQNPKIVMAIEILQIKFLTTFSVIRINNQAPLKALPALPISHFLFLPFPLKLLADAMIRSCRTSGTEIDDKI